MRGKRVFTRSLSVLLSSVSDSAPEEAGLCCTLTIHGDLWTASHWLFCVSILCLGMSDYTGVETVQSVARYSNNTVKVKS